MIRDSKGVVHVLRPRIRSRVTLCECAFDAKILPVRLLLCLEERVSKNITAMPTCLACIGRLKFL